MLGNNNTAMASTAGTANRNIITVPCMVNSWLYSACSIRWLSGAANCVRINSASTPANRKKRKAVAI